MRIVFFELEGWEETLLKETSFDGHALELSTQPLAERTSGGRQEAEVVSVFTHFPLNHSLLNRDSVVITPHIAFNSREAVQPILEATGENIRAFSGGQLRDLVGNSHLRSAPFTPGVANLDKLPAEASFDAEMAARHVLVQR